MKNKKLILLISLIIILLIMAGGYAIYSSQLKVTGTGSIDSNFNIEVTDITEESKKGKAVSVTEPTYTSSTATFNTKLQRPGDNIEYEVELTNNGTVDGKINAITITNPSRVAEVETRGIAEGEIIKSGEVKTYIVRVYIPKSVKIEEDVTSVIEVNTEIVQDDNQIFNADIDGIEANKLEIVSTKEESDYTSIKATVNAKGNGLKYYYSLDGEVWTNGITTNTYTFTGLEIGTRYTVYYKVEDENLNYVTESKWIETKDTTSPVITVSNETEWMASKEVTITYPEIEGATYQYKIGSGEWQEASQTQNVEVIENTIVYAKIIYDGNEIESEKEVSKIDSGDISLELATSATTNSITVVANAEAKSGLTKYEYSVDGGETWKDNGRYNNYTFKNLVYNTTYNIKVRVTSGNGKTVTKTIEVKTNSISTPTFEESGTTTKTVTITYPSGCGSDLTCTYIKDSEEEVEVTSNTANVEFTGDGTLIAKVSDGKNEVSNTYNIIVDRTVTYDYSTNGGSSATKTSDVVAVSSSVDLTPTATKSGWTFVGWNTDEDATSALSSLSMPASNVTLYAIYRKEAVTLTAKFNANGAELSSTTDKTCTLSAVYNNNTQDTSCTVDAPVVTREGYSKIGYNTSASSTSNNSSYSSSTGKITLTSSNTGSTWYAITSKVITITFNKNGASTQTNSSGTAVSDSSVTRTCTMYNTDASCSVTSPTIVGASGFSVVGYNTSSTATTSTWNHNTAKDVSANATYNAITKKDGKTITISYSKGTGVSSIGATSNSCKIDAVYNGATQAETCSVTLPTITTATEYTANGWYSGSTKIGNAGDSINVSANATYTATASDTVKPTVTLSPTSQGTYVSGGKAVTLTLKDAGSGLKASQNIYYAWSTSNSSAPSYSSYVTSTNSAGAASATVTVPASSSSSLTGTYYLWIKVGTLSDVSNNTNLVATSSAFKFDNTDPNLSVSTSKTSKSITVVANASAESGITKYEYSKDGGSNWTTGTTNTYTFDNLDDGTSYSIRVRVTSGVNKTATSTSTSVTTTTLSTPTFEESGTTTKTVTITYPSGCGSDLTCTYIKDSEEEVEVTSNTANVEFTGDGTLIAKVSDGKNEVSNTYNIIVDRTVTYDYSTNGGSSATKTSDVVAVSSSVDLTPTATKSGWTFVGWNTDEDATNALSSLSMPANNVTLYAIYRKEAVTLTAKFNANGSSLSSSSDKSCTLSAVYNNNTQDTSCTVDAPVVTRDGYSKIGYNTSASSTSNNSNYNVSTGKLTLTSSNTGSTWYAITSKVITITFNKNGASTQTNSSGTAVSDSSVTRTCTMYNTDASCSVTSPEVVAASGFSVVGYNTSSTATTSTWDHKTAKEVSESATYNAITKKDAITYTVTFNKNGAASQTNASGTAVTTDTVTRECTIAAVYNGASQATSCSITSPDIVGSTNTPTVVGYNTSSSATTSSWNENTAKSISTNATYYAITKKDAITYTITFNKNGASTQTNASGTAVSDASVTRACTISAVYNGATQATTCSITSPDIVGSTNTPTVVGYNTSSSATTSSWNENTAKSISANATYYAITMVAAKTITISYAKGTGVSAIGATSNSCTIAATYNGTAQAGSCSVTLPTITTATEYTANGWYSGSTKIGNAGDSVSVSASATYTATATDTVKPTVTLSPTSQSTYVSGGKAVTLTLKDDGSRLEARQKIYYAWSTSSSSAPSYSSYVTSTNSAGATSATVTVPASASSSLTGTYYLWIKAGTVSDVVGNVSKVKISSAFKFDNTDPSLSVTTSKTTKSITVVANASAESGITKYEFSSDGGTNWTTGTSNTYTFDNLTQGTSYSIRVRVTSGVSKTTTSTSTSVTTNNLDITFAVANVGTETSSTYGWASQKKVTVTYSNTCGSNGVTCSYSYDNSVGVFSTRSNTETVSSGTSANYTYNGSGTMTATISDGKNTTSESYTVTKVGAIATTLINNGVVTSGSGLYHDTYESSNYSRFVYKGKDNVFNYVTLKNQSSDVKCFRIVAIESDGTIKLVSNNNYYTDVAWSSSTSHDWTAATIRTTLNTEFEKHVDSSENSISYYFLSHRNWYYGSVNYNAEPNQTLQTTIAAEKSLQVSNSNTGYLFGLLGISDHIRASSNASCTSIQTARDGNCTDNWLNRSGDGQVATMNVTGNDTTMVVVAPNNDGYTSMSALTKTSESFEIKPAGYYNAAATILSGSGTYSDPYIFSGY